MLQPFDNTDFFSYPQNSSLFWNKTKCSNTKNERLFKALQGETVG